MWGPAFYDDFCFVSRFLCLLVCVRACSCGSVKTCRGDLLSASTTPRLHPSSSLSIHGDRRRSRIDHLLFYGRAYLLLQPSRFIEHVLLPLEWSRVTFPPLLLFLFMERGGGEVTLSSSFTVANIFSSTLLFLKRINYFPLMVESKFSPMFLFL